MVEGVFFKSSQSQSEVSILRRFIKLSFMAPSMPFMEPNIQSMPEVFAASLKTPVRDEFIAAVGPPDCATAMLNIVFLRFESRV